MQDDQYNCQTREAAIEAALGRLPHGWLLRWATRCNGGNWLDREMRERIQTKVKDNNLES